jgi:hypothetical protein
VACTGAAARGQHGACQSKQRQCEQRCGDGVEHAACGAIAAELGAPFSGWDELSEEAMLPLRSGVDVNRLVDQIADFVGTRTSVVFRSDTRTDTEVAGPPRN